MVNFFNRTGHVEVIKQKTFFTTQYKTADEIVYTTYHGDVMKVMDGIDFKFKIKKLSDMTSTNCYADVSILGLSRETIKALATTRPVGIEQTLQKRVRVYASYEDFGDNLIFDGDIVMAQPSMPPDNWLNIKAFVGNYRHFQLYSSSINEELQIGRLMENGARELGLKKVKFCDANDAKVRAEMIRKIKGFDCSGTKADLLQMLNRVSDFYVFEDNGMLVCKLRDDGRRSRTTAAVISESTGMIGIPEVLVGSVTGKGKKKSSDDSSSSLRLKVTCFINPSIQLWDLVYLQSVYLSDADGYYTVNEIEYSGHLRGQDWYMTLTLTATNVGRT